MSLSKKHLSSILLTVLVSIGLIASAWWWVNQQQANNPPQSVAQDNVTLEGQLVCLPKRGDGPHTMECAYGLLSNGQYYALDLSQTNLDLFQYTFEDQLRLTGDLLDPDPNTTYAITGTLKVTEIETIQAST